MNLASLEAWLLPVIMTGCAWTSFSFAAAESAFFSLSKWKTRRLAANIPERGGKVEQLLAAPQDLLSTLALGSTLSNSALFGVGLWWAINRSTTDIVVTLIGLLALILGGCEILPKTLAVRSSEKWALRLAPTMLWARAISYPVRTAAQWVNHLILKLFVPKSVQPKQDISDEEYIELLDMAYQQGFMDRSERDIIEEIIQLDRHTAEEIMKPRSEMACIEDGLSSDEMKQAACKHKKTRLPIFHDTPDTIVGVLNTRKLLLHPKHDLANAIEFPSFVPASMNLLQLLKSLQRQRRGLAIVVDEYGGTAGLITVEDILEEMVGEIREEGQPNEFTVEKLGRDSWRVNGVLPVEDFKEIFPPLRGLPEVDTMGGLLVALHEVVPRVGESARIDGLILTAAVADERRVRELLVKKIQATRL